LASQTGQEDIKNAIEGIHVEGLANQEGQEAISSAVGLVASQLAAALRGIVLKTTNASIGTLTVTENGTYDANDDSDYDAYEEVVVSVPNSYETTDEGKVVSNGSLVSQSSRNISANGTYDTTENNEVDVDVPNSYETTDEGKVVSDGSLVGQTSRNITLNGTYDTTENNEVVVNVSGGGSDGTFIIPCYVNISSDSVFSTPVYGNYVFTAAQAFGNERQHWWGAGDNSQHWLKIAFEVAVIINKITFSNAWTQGNSKWQSSNVVFQGSNDDSAWTDLLTLTGLTLSESAVDYNINNNTPYLYYRFLCASTTANYTGLGKIKLYGKNSN
jgi:hypothetical protein